MIAPTSVKALPGDFYTPASAATTESPVLPMDLRIFLYNAVRRAPEPEKPQRVGPDQPHPEPMAPRVRPARHGAAQFARTHGVISRR